MYYETRFRSFVKAVLWRIIAFLNSWLVLCFYNTDKNFNKALVMNITGLAIFYIYERVCNTIKQGKKAKKDIC